MALPTNDPLVGFEFRRGPQRTQQKALLELRNGDTFGQQSLIKRKGYRGTSNQSVSEEISLEGQLQGAGYRLDELFRIQNDDVWGYVEPSDAWRQAGAWPVVLTQEPTRLTQPKTIRTASFAEQGDYRVLVWQELVGDPTNPDALQIWFSVQDFNGTTIQLPSLVASAATLLTQPRAVACGKWIAVTYFDDNASNVVIRRWQPESPLTLSAPITLSTAVGYDLLGVPDRNQLWVARPIIAMQMQQLTEVRADLTIDRDRALPGLANTTVLAVDRLSATQEILVGALNNVSASEAKWYDDALSTINSYAPLVTSVRVTVVITDSTTGYLFTERVTNAPTDPEPGVEVSQLDRNGAAITPTGINLGFALGLAGRAVARNGDAFVLCIYPNHVLDMAAMYQDTIGGLQSDTSYFVIRGRDRAVVSRGGVAGQATTWGGRFTVEEINLMDHVERTTGFAWSVTIRTAFRPRTTAELAPGGFETLGAEVIAEIDHDFENAQARTADGFRLASWALGGFFRSYDGRRTFETDFHLPPNIETTTDSAAPDAIPPGDYVYAVTYFWRDQNGRRYRSLVGTKQHTVAVLANVEVVIRNLRITERDDIQLEVWRTTIGTSTPFFLLTNPGNPVINDRAAFTTLFVDTNLDTAITSNEQLLLEPAAVPGILSHDILQVSGFAALAGDRLWARSTTNPCRLFASLLPATKEGPAWNSTIFNDLDTQEEARVILAQDRSLIAISQRFVSTFTGRGQDNAGLGPPFQLPAQVPTTEGSALNGVATIGAIGLMYATTDGPAMVSRDQTSQSPTGQIAELYRDTAQEIVEIVHLPRESELWVFDSNDIAVETLTGTLSFSTQTYRWSQHTQLQAVGAATSINGAFAIARTDGDIVIRDPSTCLTAGERTPLIITPAWQRPQQNMLAPYSCAAIGLTLLFFEDHRLRIDVLANDDIDNIVGTVTVDADRGGLRTFTAWADVVPAALWADFTEWGTDGGNTGKAYYVKLQFGELHCSSITVRMQDDPGDTKGYGYVQMVTRFEPRESVDGIDVLDARRSYPVNLV